ncbi:MAG TPA: hypothetical protein VHV27_03940 [Phenylobacterium sp.]|nr:hypothetical protein [Phenylobacterium sp.]
MSVLALLLAAAAGAVQPAPSPAEPGKVVSPLVVLAPRKTPPPADATVQVGSDSDHIGGQDVSIWPAGARERGVSGHVTLTCQIDDRGLAETCAVAYEDPPGQGFGAAALALRPTIKLAPRQGPRGPVAASMNIAVNFTSSEAESNLRYLQTISRAVQTDPGGGMTTRQHQPVINGPNLMIRHNPVAMRGVTLLDWPAWARAPGFDDVAGVYPAQAGGAEGYVVVHCRVGEAGALGHCGLVKELPVGKGFGKAALALAPRFQVSPDTMAQAPRGAPVEVDVPVRFAPPTEAKDRTVRAPVWLAGAGPDSLAIPPEAHARANSPGALVKCEVAADGALTDCAIELTSPDGIDFDEAAVKLASRLKMNLWSAEAGPVEGGIVHVPVRLSPADGAQAQR